MTLKKLNAIRSTINNVVLSAPVAYGFQNFFRDLPPVPAGNRWIFASKVADFVPATAKKR